MWELAGGALLIFGMRIADVSLGTVRQIMAVRGHGVVAALIGFVEVSIFLMAISRVLGKIDEHWFYVVAYSGGFATGTVVGVWLEQLIGLGTRMIRVITRRRNDELVTNLRAAGFGVTQIDGQGKNGHVYLLLSMVRRKAVPRFIEILKCYSPHAMYTVEEVRFSHGGVTDVLRKSK